MSIRPDRWIARMAKEHGMIEPFSDRQVREGVISYGVSSYGYDVRVADEFKIFTNVYAATVDPKNFDPRSFVDWQGETCIVPPNSFALARTIEYFRIPRNVLTICVGKSTYARCLAGDTRVALVDGSAPTIEEMAERNDHGEMFWGYAMGPYERLIVALLDAPRYVGTEALLEILLDNEAPIRCTPDHEFIRRDGRVVRAAEVRAGDSLMPLYRQDVRGYEVVYQPINGHIYPTHRLADEWNVRNGVYQDEAGTHRHHKDRDKRNNNPWNLERMKAGDHIRLHNEDTFGESFDPEAHGTRIRAALSRRAQDPVWARRFSDLQRDDGGRRDRQKEIACGIRLREEIDEAVVRRALESAGTIRGAARALGCDRSVFRRFPGVIEAYRSSQPPRARNHRVERVRSVPGSHDVYCLTVPEAGNFALACGVFTLNCGIIVNVTPFEPEWEGHVTLEISNTTPLPAKIYANEGIAQVLFFESDEPCEMSYADRGGKYQAQRGVTLPKL